MMSFILLIIIILSVSIVSLFMLIVFKPNVAILSVIRLNVAAPSAVMAASRNGRRVKLKILPECKE
jgi:hypothetical protein